MSRRTSDIQGEGGVAERLMTRWFLILHAWPERLQWAFLGSCVLAASTVIAVVPETLSRGSRFLVAMLLISLVYFVTLGCSLSVMLKSPRWRLLELQEDMQDLRHMPGVDFEQFVKELLEERGFSVELRGGRRPDGGIDLIARQRGRTYAVQCKQWRQYVGRPFVQQLYGVVSSTVGIDGGIFVTTGLYSEEARDFERSLKGRRPSVRLIDGKELWAAVEEVRRRRGGPAA